MRLVYLLFLFILVINLVNTLFIDIDSKENESLDVELNEEGGFLVKSGTHHGKYLTHVDNHFILHGGISELLKHQYEDAILPIIDFDEENNDNNNNNRIIGYVKISSFTPSKLRFRDESINIDPLESQKIAHFENGKILVNNQLLNNVLDYNPPPHGTGHCISSKECYNNNGTCIASECQCNKHRTGSYCQISQPDNQRDVLNKMIKNSIEQQEKNLARQQAQLLKDQEEDRLQEERLKKEIAAKERSNRLKQESDVKSSHHHHHQQQQQQQMKEQGMTKEKDDDSIPQPEVKSDTNNNRIPGIPSSLPTIAPPTDDDTDNTTVDANVESKVKVKAKAKVKVKVKGKSKGKVKAKTPATITANSNANGNGNGNTDSSSKKNDEEEEEGATGTGGDASRQNSQNSRLQDQEALMARLFGPDTDQPYPPITNAGKVDRNTQVARQKAQQAGLDFMFALRFRVGPFGLAFDNSKTNVSIVERVLDRHQASDSGVQVGDHLIAVNAVNVTDAPAKVVMRMMSGIGFPIVLTFLRKNSKDTFTKNEDLSKRNLYLHVLYPPSLQGQYNMLASEWAGSVEVLEEEQHCPVYLLRSGKDIFGCTTSNVNLDDDDEDDVMPLGIPQGVRRIMIQNASVEEQASYPMLSMLAASLDLTEKPLDQAELEKEEIKGLEKEDREGGSVDTDNDKDKDDTGKTETETETETKKMKKKKKKGMMVLDQTHGEVLELRTASLMKRGVCTFVDKASVVGKEGAQLGLMVNTDDELLDLPKGRENTQDLNDIFATLRASEGGMIHLSTMLGTSNDDNTPNIPQEVLAVVSSEDEDEIQTGACGYIRDITEDIVNRWPHSVPAMPLDTIFETNADTYSNVRGERDEGGRVAVAGQNGWAFFDYHLAAFGPQEVPLGPHRLVMASPSPFGCDPSEYTVRLSGGIVAILRGGGCSFGIKVINAQSLGAKAVIIVNTDTSKTMRLMALADEMSQIKIPCIMVSNRFQRYLEHKIRYFYAADQHIISIHPTGVFGQYETRSAP